MNVPLFVHPAEITVNILSLSLSLSFSSSSSFSFSFSFSFGEAINRRDPKRKPFNHYKTLPSRQYYIRQASRISFSCRVERQRNFEEAGNEPRVWSFQEETRASTLVRKVGWRNESEPWQASRQTSQPDSKPSQSASQPTNPAIPSHPQSVSRALFIWSSTTPAST